MFCSSGLAAIPPDFPVPSCSLFCLLYFPLPIKSLPHLFPFLSLDFDYLLLLSSHLSSSFPRRLLIYFRQSSLQSPTFPFWLAFDSFYSFDSHAFPLLPVWEGSLQAGPRNQHQSLALRLAGGTGPAPVVSPPSHLSSPSNNSHNVLCAHAVCLACPPSPLPLPHSFVPPTSTAQPCRWYVISLASIIFHLHPPLPSPPTPATSFFPRRLFEPWSCFCYHPRCPTPLFSPLRLVSVRKCASVLAPPTRRRLLPLSS